MAVKFTAKEIFVSDNEIHMISEPISVEDMHRIAKEPRDTDEKISFAAVAE